MPQRRPLKQHQWSNTRFRQVGPSRRNYRSGALAGERVAEDNALLRRNHNAIHQDWNITPVSESRTRHAIRCAASRRVKPPAMLRLYAPAGDRLSTSISTDRLLYTFCSATRALECK
ncbi:hypothetical protein SKAU_G00333210 [Synaphobranchus kaupii]|uniref:Uncharacterized protein n=1 Tax=Synaphobranchus kaupii TaxID=118154 RepID=A0A9Q1ELI5_SYNKA|nr:hypothetical protein SKAU_G00333210 [Synaphobranchus kaupii]